jgi:hypothetical protein
LTVRACSTSQRRNLPIGSDGQQAILATIWDISEEYLAAGDSSA